MDVTFTYKIEGIEVSGDVYYNITNYMFAYAVNEEGNIRWNFKEDTERYIDKYGKTHVVNNLSIMDWSSMKKLFFDIVNKVDLSSLWNSKRGSEEE